MSLYNISIIKVGECALEALSEDMLILFNESVPEDAAEYCFIHNHDTLKGDIAVGGKVDIDGVNYPITAVGDAVNQNLGNLGHITLRFDGANTADFIGSLHLSGAQPRTLVTGSTFTFS
ncbi:MULTISPECIES: PTS glucitol/sorbitol transporter subunit IIA [unclassified Vibrio]|uniref:PTS glucitol/sorbitol transporter subunit IIA n=1 Tax=unclassified Vibrio TaxID=2614977 RepID=UPI00189E1014|nr:PTS glucitol/sorbitol transporter subunit IIA [Vibrio sp. VB16]UGA54046.1 PTS glucitol/sorbitol transporter subunit IIA [Vibrio sp. VB16]